MFQGSVAAKGARICRGQTMTGPTTRHRGLMMVTLAAILWSTAGLFVRLIDLDVWTTLAWRSLFAALSLGLIVVARSGWRGFGRAIGRAGGSVGRWAGLWAVPVAVISMGSYVAALKLTTVANVMVIYATVPFVAAGLAFLFIGERASPRILRASAGAFVGVLVMAATQMRPPDLAGNAVAFLMTLAFGAQLVMARRHPALDMAPVNAIAAALCAVGCLPFLTGVVPGPFQMLMLALFGATNTALAYLFFLVGGRHVPSSEAGFIGTIDVILGPLWVWLAFGEVPGQTALIGGGIVLAAVFYYLAGGLRGRTPG